MIFFWLRYVFLIHFIITTLEFESNWIYFGVVVMFFGVGCSRRRYARRCTGLWPDGKPHWGELARRGEEKGLESPRGGRFFVPGRRIFFVSYPFVRKR